jgi:hypothetical protein
MPSTYTLISSVTVGSGGTQFIDFTSIPQTYTDLLLKVSIRNNASANNNTVGLRFNGDNGNTTAKRLYGTGSTANSDSDTQVIDVGNNATANTFANIEFYVPNYTLSNYKSYSADGVGENNATTAFQTLLAGLWSSTSAITSMRLRLEDGSLVFQQYSTAYLYGISNA